jgi:hypothetical protein
MLNSILSRRDFLKLGSATLLGLLFSELHLDPAQAAASPLQGRVLATSLVVRDTPAFSGKKIRSVKRDVLLDIAEAVFLADRVVLLSPRPGTVAEVFEVPLPRPRLPDHRFSGDFAAICRAVKHAMQGNAEEGR